MKEFDVITIGSVTRDVFLKSPDFKVVKDENYRTGRAMNFMLGTKLEIPKVAISGGGGGSNTATTFARQGFKTGCIVRVGDDDLGEEIKKSLEKDGIDTSISQIDKEHDSAMSTILVSEDGERTIMEYRGANDYMSADEIDWDNIKSKWLYIDSLGGKEDLLEKLLDWADKNGTKVAYNPGKGMVRLGTGLQKYLNKVDIFSVNEDEAAYVAGIEYKEEKEPEIFNKLDKIVRGIVVMSKGPRGVEVSDDEFRYTAGIPDSPVVDRTGAGDSFGSGFTSGYIHSGGDIVEAIQLGTANATSVVQYFGGQEGCLKKNEWGDYPKIEVKKEEIKK